MEIKKTIIVPVHYSTTKEKINKLDKTTARITYGLQCINKLIDEDTEISRKSVGLLVKSSNVAEKTGLSSGFVQQCIDKVIWSWKSYNELHDKWLKSVESAVRREKEIYLMKLINKEPMHPDFHQKTPVRIDKRTGRIEKNKKSKLTKLWMHLSTSKKGKTIDIPLNPCSEYHLKQLKEGDIKDFEVIKKDKKYYAHISVSKEIDDKKITSFSGIDQGINHSAAIVLLSKSLPYEGVVCDKKKQEQLLKYEEMIGELQNAKKWKKLRKLRNKRLNISTYYDWQIANEITQLTKGSLLGISDTKFRQTQYRGNEMAKLRKLICKWSYSRQRAFITLKRAELGYQTLLVNEWGSNRCHKCGSKMVQRKWLSSGESYILCHSCGLKKDADINASYNIAYETILRCQKCGLKVEMNTKEICMSLQERIPHR